MKYVVYIDVFFLVNLVMDWLILRVTAVYIKPDTTWLRCLYGSVAGSAFAVLSLLVSYENIICHMMLTYVVTAVVMVYITYGRTNIKSFIARVGWIYLITIVLGGAMSMVYNYTYLGYVLHGVFNLFGDNPLNIGSLILFTTVSYIILSFLSRLWTSYRSRKFLVKTTIDFKGVSVEVHSLIDSGNTLICPYTGKPVHIVCTSAIENILKGVNIHDEKYRLVPFHSLGRRNGLIEVIQCDEITVYVHNEVKDDNKLIYQEKHPAIGLYTKELSVEKKYRMLLNGIVSKHI